MSLAERAAKLARAKPGDSTGRQIVLVAAVGLLVAAMALGPIWLGIPAALVIGLVASRDPERYYLEGFSDGLAALPEAGRPADTGARGADVAFLPADAGDDRSGAGWDSAVVRPTHRGFGPAAGRVETDDLGRAFGVQLDAGPPRPALDTEGRPLPGPRRPSAGAVKAASSMGAPVRIPAARPKTGTEADAG